MSPPSPNEPPLPPPPIIFFCALLIAFYFFVVVAELTPCHRLELGDSWDVRACEWSTKLITPSRSQL